MKLKSLFLIVDEKFNGKRTMRQNMGNCCSDDCLKDISHVYNDYERLQPPAALRQANNRNDNSLVKKRDNLFPKLPSSDSFDDEFIQNGREV